MVTQTPHPTATTKPSKSALQQVIDLAYVVAQMVLPIALGVTLVALGQRSGSLAPLISWLTSEPLRPLGVALVALGISLVAEALSTHGAKGSETDAAA